MKNEKIIALLKKEIKNAEAALIKAEEAEKNWDYSDSTLTMERAYAEGYAEALYFVSNRIEEKEKK